MIKVSVMYPNNPGSHFDHDYYRDQHMSMVKRLMGDACLSFGVDRGLAGGAPDAPAAYVATGHLFCESIEGFQAAFAPHAKVIQSDIVNYTDIAPQLLISEVVVG
ncbi:EthD family reductase [Pseudomonas sp. 5Ae-yellow]|uniref:EthD family reductase n=1 Tax=Pseudomonas sp. 5Ae-yellow TaxID=2759848 RepID=UPI0015F69FDD|nr:EthD family reductase [Pseudomonas sp. 5Ae-yellow]MBA6421618.1 EthD family reductase [Pseudomonas sp. 5Ae-yellow]